jgi:hypothetical protein
VHQSKKSIDLRHASPPDAFIIYWELLIIQAPKSVELTRPVQACLTWIPKLPEKRHWFFFPAQEVTMPQLVFAEAETRRDSATSQHEKALIGQLNFGIQAQSISLSMRRASCPLG